MNRPFDILIYGATGLAGKHVAKHFLKNHPEIKIAIAGRNQAKLTKLVTDLNEPLGTATITSDQILVASSDDAPELVQILSQAKVCIACAGPFRLMGKNIVEAAIQAQTDYLDLCGEPQFFDDMLTAYDAQARDRNTLVISACAFDCVPAEMSYQFAAKELVKKYKSSSIPVTNVEVVHTFSGIKCANSTTFHAAVDGFHASYTGELKASRQKVKDTFPELKNMKKKNKPSEWKKMISSPGMTSPLYHEFTKSYILKFMGADAACILASDRYLRLRLSDEEVPTMPFFSVSFGLSQKSHAYTFLGFGAVFATLAKWSWGCKILHSNPELFTKGFFKDGGPTEEEMKDAKFSTSATAYGLTKDQCVKVKFSGGEPGYVATSAIMSALALTVLHHRDSMKFEGGVMLPGAAFSNCEKVYNILRQEGMQIDVVENYEDRHDSENDEKV